MPIRSSAVVERANAFECFTGQLVNDVRELQPATIAGLIELEIDSPHITRPDCARQWLAWLGAATFATTWSGPGEALHQATNAVFASC